MMQLAEALLAVIESEPWNTPPATPFLTEQDPEWIGEVIELARLIYEVIARKDSAWQRSVASGKVPYRDAEDRYIGEVYRRWLALSRKIVESANRGSVATEGLDDLAGDIEEAQCLLDSREIEGSMRPIDEILPLARGNPRPEHYGR